MKCPICKAQLPENPPPGVKSCFPFCSERCKLIDLGRWLGGRYQIPVRPNERDDLPLDSHPTGAPDDDDT